jgi:hypothetical protein
MGLGALVLDLTASVGRELRVASPAPRYRAVPPAEGSSRSFLALQAEERHERLFSDPLGFPRSPAGFRAEDVVGEQGDFEGFVPVDEAARRMEIPEAEVLELTRSAYLLSRWNRGRLLVRPGVL